MRSTKEIQSGAATHHSQDISLPGIDQQGKELTLALVTNLRGITFTLRSIHIHFAQQLNCGFQRSNLYKEAYMLLLEQFEQI